jgi:acetyl-CoA carboxylase carboxyl transferase subunit alpha
MLTNPLDFEKPIAELDDLIDELKKVGRDPDERQDAVSSGIDVEAEIARFEASRKQMARKIYSNLTPWNEVQMARHTDRPYTLDYIGMIFDDFVELHGDRTNADDPAIVGGIARFGTDQVVVMGHQKARDLKGRQMRNFGSARPAGFRKALRLMKLAEKFKRPLIVFVDTPAAEANLMAEEEGISETIAICLREMVMISVPIVVSVIGEGGSGGALGIAVGDRVLMLEHSVYSVIPPEGCAAILWNDRNRAAEAAGALKLTAKHALDFGLVDEVLEEPLGGAHRDPTAMAVILKQAITRNLAELKSLCPDKLLSNRYDRFRNMGRWEEAETVIGELVPET